MSKSDKRLASEYDDLAYKALANPDLSEGLANQIARVSRNTARAIRAERSDKGEKRSPYKPRKQPAKQGIEITLPPDLAAWAKGQEGGASAYIRSLIEADMSKR